MDKLLFGTGGTPLTSRSPSSADGIRRCAELGLGCMELEFVRGVKMGETAALQLRKVAAESSIRLTAHGPYFINLNAREPDKVAASKERIWQTAHIGNLCGATSITFHAAFYMGDPPEEVYHRVKQALQEIVQRLKAEGNQISVRPEITGKPTQFGSLEEVLRLSQEIDVVQPCVDFAHWHARTGANSYAEFADALRQIETKLGKESLHNMHIHLSGIKYNKKGELSHLNLKDSDMQYLDLLRALKDFDVKGFIICESPDLEADALLLQESFSKLT